MRLYRCLACLCSFAIHLKNAKDESSGVSCPLCKGEVEEIDAIKEAGGHLAKRFVSWFNSLPSGDD